MKEEALNSPKFLMLVSIHGAISPMQFETAHVRTFGLGFGLHVFKDLLDPSCRVLSSGVSWIFWI